MTRIIRHEAAAGSPKIQSYAEPYLFNGSRSERRYLRLGELDKDYRHQLKLLNRIAQKARDSFMASVINSNQENRLT